MIKMLPRAGLLLAALILFPLGCQTTLPKKSGLPEVIWNSKSSQGETRIHLYIFWSQTCPHCRKALNFVGSLRREYSWLEIHPLEISRNPENVERFKRISESLGKKPNMVPTFFFCQKMREGFHSAETTGKSLREALRKCYLSQK